MFRSSKVLACLFTAAGATLGWVAASSPWPFFQGALASPPASAHVGDGTHRTPADDAGCCPSDSGVAVAQLPLQAATATALLAPAQRAEAEEVILFDVLVPADAALEINGTKMAGTGAVRHFETPPVAKSGHYSYTLKAMAKGKEVTKKIGLAHGSHNTFDLRSELGDTPAKPSAAKIDAKPSKSKPNILFIMGDDIGWMQPGCYHRGLMVGETPHIDRIAKEGGMFMHYYAESSCTAGRTAFITGMNPYRAGMLMPQLPGAISYLRPGTPCIGKFMLDLGYTTGQFGKNHVGDHPDSLPTAHGFQEFWGYLYHLDAMQQVSFPDINKTPTQQGVVPPMKMVPIPGVPNPPGEIDPKDGACMAAPRPVLWMKSSDGTAKNQTGKDEGPLTLERSKTIDEEIAGHVIDFLDRNDPKKTNKPFFCYYNPARMHITTMLSQKYMDMLGVKGGKDWGINEAGMKQMDDCIGTVLKKLEDMGELDNTIIVFTTDNGAETQTFPDGGITPFKGMKLTTWEGGMRAPCMIRWPGHVKPGTVYNEMFCALDWVPTLVEIGGGPKGNALNEQIMGGKYPGIVKTKLDGVNQLAYLEGKSEQSARDTFFYYQGHIPSAVRYKNWKFYYTMMGSSGLAAFGPPTPFHWTQVQNIKRDPFEQCVGADQKSAFSAAGALASPSTAYVYDWNLLPIGQLLWTKELESYREFPPLQLAASYNLEQVLEQMKRSGSGPGK